MNGEVSDRRGDAWAAAIVGVAFGTISAACVLLSGGSVWLSLGVYVLAGNLGFVAFLAVMFLASARRGVDIRISRPIVGSRTASDDSSIDISSAQWIQREAIGVPISEKRVLIAGSTQPGGYSVDLANHISARNECVDICNQLDSSIQSILENPGTWGVLFVELDECAKYDDITDVIDDLVVFRRIAPEVPVIVMSSDFMRDDLGTDRLPAMDVSIRLPSSSSHILNSVGDALCNNRIWQERQRKRQCMDRVAQKPEEKPGAYSN